MNLLQCEIVDKLLGDTMFEFFSISLLFLLGAMSPGPDFIMVSKNSLQYSKRAGVMTALGISCGTFIHASYCILGLAVIIAKSLLIFTLIKYAGAIYLVYLGLKDVFSKQSSISVDVVKTNMQIASLVAFRQGFICTILNPKAIFFFLALFTMVIKPSMPMLEQFSYAFENSSIDMMWFSFIAMMFSSEKIKLILKKFQNHIAKACGGVLILFGLKIAGLHHA